MKKEEKEKKDIESTSRKWFERAKYSALGLEMGLSVVVGYFLGKWADEKLGTSPWLLFLCVVCGFIAGLRSVIRLVKEHQKKQQEKEEQNSTQ